MLHNLKYIIHLITAFLCLFFSIYLLTQKKGKHISNLLLSSFLIAKAVSEAGGALFHFVDLKRLILEYSPSIFYIDLPFCFLYVPLLYLYVLSITQKNFVVKKIHLLHTIPFWIFFIIVIRFQLQDINTVRHVAQENSLFSISGWWVVQFLISAQFLGYMIFSLMAVKSYRERIKNFYSNIDRINLSWLNFVLWGFIIYKSLMAAESIIWILTQRPHPILITMYISAEVIFLIFISLIIYKALNQPEIFLDNNTVNKGNGKENSNGSKKKYEKNLLPDEFKEEYKKRLIEFMQTKKPFLNSSLCLDDIAKKISIPNHHLSQVINGCFHQNFFDFVNWYRIEESKKLLSENGTNKKTILEILYQTGFNSKSVFNTAFKKYTGVTPTQFRKNIYSVVS